MRIRTIKPDFWEDETVGTLSRDARLLFIACFNLADDTGRLRWHPAYIKSAVFMYDDDLDVPHVAALMTELTDACLVREYVAGKVPQRLAAVANFLKHQVINRAQPSKFPTPDWEADPSVNDSLNDSLNDSVNDSVNDHGQLTVPFTVGREGNGKEIEGKGKTPAASRSSRSTTLPAGFEVTDAMRKWAETKAPSVDLTAQTEKFQNWHEAKGSKFVNWEAAWRTWMTRATEFAKETPDDKKEWW